MREVFTEYQDQIHAHRLEILNTRNDENVKQLDDLYAHQLHSTNERETLMREFEQLVNGGNDRER